MSPQKEGPENSLENEGGRRVGYARVSTADQNTRLQHDALERAGCVRLFTDGDRSGAERNRPALARALRQVRPGDTLVVWKLDRLARSLQDLLDITDALKRRGVAFESLTEKIETGSAYGEFVFHIIAAVAHMERRLIAERTRAGLAAAKRRGIRLGRRPKLDERTVRRAYRQVRTGRARIGDIAARHEVARITVTRAFARYGLENATTTGGMPSN